MTIGSGTIPVRAPRVHAAGNVIDCLPKRMQPKANGLLSEIIGAPTRKDAKRGAVVHGGWGHQPDPRVAVRMVVPRAVVRSV